MSDPSPSTDLIQKHRILPAPRSRVWRALSDHVEFGTWFRMRFDRPFEPGTKVSATILEPGYEGTLATLWVEAVEPEHRLVLSWHPYAMDPAHDYSTEPRTRITFTLEDHPDGTALTVVESGFDALPPWRRAESLPRNDAGWRIQLERIDAHVRRAG